MRRVTAVPAALLSAAVAVALVLTGTPTTSGAFVASVRSTTATAATNPSFTCAGEVGIDATTALFAYSFDDASGSSTAADVSGHAPAANGSYQGAQNKSVARGICYRDQLGFPYVLKGTTGFVLSPSVSVNGAFTLETWFSTSTSTTSTARPTKMGFLFGSGAVDTATPAANAVGLYMTSDGRLVFGVGGGTTTVTTPAGTSYADGYWWHVVATYSAAGGAALYINGRLIGTALPPAALPAITGQWRLGYTAPTGWPLAPADGHFSGSMRFAALYSSALSPASIAQHAAAGAVPRSGSDPWPDYRG